MRISVSSAGRLIAGKRATPAVSPPYASGVVVPLVLAAAVCLVALPFARSHMVWRDVADAYIHLVRIFVVDAALQRGELYPRWLPDLYLGYGYPLLNYYAPATYYAGALLHRLGLTIYGSLQALGAFSVALGAAGTYALAWRTCGGRRAAALAAATGFVLAPYPFQTNLYVRAALPETLALGLLPWLFLFAWTALSGARWAPFALTGTAALLLLTHNVGSLIGFGLLGLWLVWLWVAGTIDDLAPNATRALATVAISLAGALAIGAFFWLPALVEGDTVQLDLLHGGIYNYRTWQFDPLRASGGTAHPDYPHTRVGPADLGLVYDYSALDKAVPAKLSAGQLALWIAGAAGGVGLLARGAPARAALPLGWALLAAVCWFMNTTWSALLWERVPLLSLVQFPWRFYGPASLFVALAATSAAALPRQSGARHAATAGVWALAGLLAAGALLGRPFLAGPDPAHDVDARLVAAEEYNKYGAGTTSGGEFLPKTARWDEGDRGQRRGIRLYDEAFPQASWQAGLVRVLAGRAAVTGVYQAPAWLMADVDAAEPATLAFHQLVFPGWRAYVDGEPATLRPVPFDEVRRASFGFAIVEVPAGNHHVELRFGPTVPRTAGTAVSAGALVAFLLLALRRHTRQLIAGRRRDGRGAGACPPPRVEGRGLVPRATLADARATVSRQIGGAPGQWPGQWLGVRLPGWSDRVVLVALPLVAATGVVVVGQVWAGPAGRPPDGSARVVVDVANAIVAGAAESRTPLGTNRSLASPYVDVRYLVVNGETRRWLYMHPPAEVRLDAHIPSGAYLQTALALDPAAWEKETGDGVRFIAEVDTAGGRVVLLDRHVNPRAAAGDRRWLDVWVDLERFAGQRVVVILRTEHGADVTYDWAGWANPQIVTWHAARPHPAARHPW